MKFQVKKNPFLVLLSIFLLPLGLLGVYTDPAEGWTGLLIVIPIAGLLLWALFQSYHEVRDDAFIAHFGPIKKRIPLRDIRKVNYSYNPLSSPAWTLKRMKVTDHQHRSYLLSAPKDEEALRDLLQQRCPHATISI
ncbi:PH domain-containing protein [Halobacillus sp. MO56]